MKKTQKKTEKEQPVAKKKKATGVVALRHKLVLDNMTKNVRNCKKPSLYQAMLDAGYSESYAKSCTNMTETKDWQKLVEKYLPDNLLATTHNDLLIARKLEYMLFNPEISDDDIYEVMAKIGCTPTKIVHGISGTHCYFFAPDNKIRKDATDMAYKVKGKLAPEKFEVEQTGLKALSDQELADLIKKQKARFRKTD